MAGIKETQEIVKVVGTLGVFVAKKLKDGAQISDVNALMNLIANDTEFQNQFKEAVVGIQNIPFEVTDIDVIEGFQLGKQGVDIVNDIVTELKS